MMCCWGKEGQMELQCADLVALLHVVGAEFCLVLRGPGPLLARSHPHWFSPFVSDLHKQWYGCTCSIHHGMLFSLNCNADHEQEGKDDICK